MAQDITLLGASYQAVPAVTLPKTGGGTASFTDVTDTTAAAADVAAGKYFYTAAGVRTEGTSSGGGGADDLPSFIMGTLTQIEDASITIIRDQGFRAYSGLTSLKIPNCTKVGSYAFYGVTGLTALALPSIGSGANDFGGQALASSSIQTLDLGTGFSAVESGRLQNATNLNTLILRSSSLVTLANTSQLNGSKFASNQSGGTLYVPSALISTYQGATNWSTILGYANNSIQKIEGSYYETHYADGTVIS